MRITLKIKLTSQLIKEHVPELKEEEIAEVLQEIKTANIEEIIIQNLLAGIKSKARGAK